MKYASLKTCVTLVLLFLPQTNHCAIYRIVVPITSASFIDAQNTIIQDVGHITGSNSIFLDPSPSILIAETEDISSEQAADLEKRLDCTSMLSSPILFSIASSGYVSGENDYSLSMHIPTNTGVSVLTENVQKTLEKSAIRAQRTFEPYIEFAVIKNTEPFRRSALVTKKQAGENYRQLKQTVNNIPSPTNSNLIAATTFELVRVNEDGTTSTLSSHSLQ